MFRKFKNGYVPVHVSDMRDQEKIFVSYGCDHLTNSQSFCRELCEEENAMLWLIFNGKWFWHHTEVSHRSPDMPGVVYDPTELLALTEEWGLTGVRFKYSGQSDPSRCHDGEDYPYAIDFDNKKVFEMKGHQYKYWSTRSQAVDTLLSKPSWWRPWCEQDYIEAIAVKNKVVSWLSSD